jgi:thymidine kinase
MTTTLVNFKMNKNTPAGYLELILGCMFSGKTTKLLEIYNMYKICEVECCVVNYDKDKRYHEELLSTHDKKMIPCINVKHLREAVTDVNVAKYDVFLVNEGQFFVDVDEVVLDLVQKHGKKVYVCGLDGDYKQQTFGNLLNLIPHCDNYSKLHAICKVCKDGTPASFSKRITNETDQEVIGSDNYIPVCRKCYISN